MKATRRLARLDQKLRAQRREGVPPCIHFYIPCNGRGGVPSGEPPCQRCGKPRVVAYVPPLVPGALP